MPILTGEKIAISDGLQGQDDNIEAIMSMWEDLQLFSLDLASQPECDLFSFAQTSFLFGVITVNRNNESDPKLLVPLSDEADSTFRFTAKSPQRNTLWPEDEEESIDLGQDYQFPGSHRRGIDDAIREDLVSFETPIEWPHNASTDALDAGVAEILQKIKDKQARNPESTVAKQSKPTAVPTSIQDIPTSEWPVARAVSGYKTDYWRKPQRPLHPRPSAERRDNDFLSSKITPFTTHSDFTLFSTQSSTHASSSAWPWDSPRNDLIKAAEAGATKKAIGMIYLAASPLSPGQAGELNLGIILNTAYRGKGYAREAIGLVLKHAFDDKHCHRIQVSLLNLSSKDRMLSLLTQLRFGHEGTKRRSFFNPMLGEWQDVTTLAILDTDWAMRKYFFKPAPKSLWDELFLRHERERDELLRWEDDQNRLNRTASMETIRAAPPDADSSNSDAASDASLSSSSTSANKGKKRAMPSDWNRDPYDGSSSDADSEFDDATFVRRRYTSDVESRHSGASSPALSDISLESIPRSVTSIRSPPSTPPASGSEWDMIESSSSSGSSFGDDDD